MTLFLPSLWREGGRVALLFVLISYLLQAAARLWPAIQFLLHYTVLNIIPRSKLF